MNINTFIDHTLLKANATHDEIKTLCNEAREYKFKAVCVNPHFVALSKKLLEGSDVLVCTVIGFPLGASTTEVKIFETLNAIRNGASEIDMVLNISELKEKNDSYVEDEIRELAKACHGNGAILKVIFETCLLTDEEIIRASKLSEKAGADFIKTSTGFSTGGATPHAVKLMLDSISDKVSVKASGGVRDIEAAKNYINMGVKRLGTSSGVKIMNGEAGAGY